MKRRILLCLTLCFLAGVTLFVFSGCKLLNFLNIHLHKLDESGYCNECDIQVTSTKGVKYKVSSGGTHAYVYDYTGNASNVVLAGVYKGVPVTEIGMRAFKSSHSVKSIMIPQSVTSIESRAFESCSSLTTIIIPNSVNVIKSYAFFNCGSLTDITIGAGVDSIGYNAFYGCESINKVNYLGTIDEWVDMVFDSEVITFSNPLWAGGNLFLNDELATEINIESANKINDFAFVGCSSIRKVVISDSVTSIGGFSFENCSQLESLTIGKGVISIKNYAFSHCDSLASVIIPENVSYVGSYVFSNSESLQNIYCEANSQPENWDSNWSMGCSAKIVWGS